MIHAGFQLPHDLAGQPYEPVALLTRKLAGRVIDHAECAESMAIRRGERNPCIEADVRFSSDQRIGAKTFVLAGIGNFH